MEEQFKQVAGLIGDPTRATIMWTLMDGKAFTATELAIAAVTTAPNISMHMSKLVQVCFVWKARAGTGITNFQEKKLLMLLKQ